MQLLTVAIPKLEELQKTGEEGQKKIAQYTRYVTVGLGFVQAVALSMGLGASQDATFLSYATIGFCLAAGTALAMWIGECITENGIGNGVSLLIFAGIIANLAQYVSAAVYTLFAGAGLANIWKYLAVIALTMLLTVAVVYVDRAERRIPTVCQRMVGRKMLAPVHPHPAAHQRQRRAAPDFRLGHHAVPLHPPGLVREQCGLQVVDGQRQLHELGLPGHLRAVDHWILVLLFLHHLQSR